MNAQNKRTKKNDRLTSIHGRLQSDITRLMGISILILAVILVALNLYSTINALKKDMSTMASITADRVSQELKVTSRVVTELGSVERLSSPGLTPEQKQEMIDQRVAAYGMVRGKLINTDGISEIDGTDYSDREYFKRALQGETVISDPVLAKTDGTLSVIVAAPVWKWGIPETEVVGVVFLVPQQDFLNNIAASIKVSDNASCYMLSSSGVTIAHTNEEIALNQENTIEMAKSDSSLNAIARLETRMIQGETGSGIYLYGGSIKILAFAPIPDTDGWSVALNAPIMDFMGGTLVSILIAVTVAIIALAVGARTAKFIGKAIGTPIGLCSERLKLLAQGDLHTPVPEIQTKDETRVLADATRMLTKNLGTVIQDTDDMLGEMAEGNFAISAKNEASYVGDFYGLMESMRKLKYRLSGTLKNVQGAVEQVNMGSVQLAQSATATAEGAMDQAGAIQELQATITTVTNTVEENAGSLGETFRQAKEYSQQAVTSGDEMKDLATAMNRINETSQQISNIIGEIEDIASQTNLLSLNASIEAARAGEAGRGFAVVAGQIRKLADDSAQSAIHTRELIETSLREIEHGNQIADRTYESLMKVVEGMEILAEASRKAMENSNTQAEAMEQIEQAIDQISQVVQSNSATAEEISATSQELSDQATSVNETVAAFRFNI